MPPLLKTVVFEGFYNHSLYTVNATRRWVSCFENRHLWPTFWSNPIAGKVDNSQSNWGVTYLTPFLPYLTHFLSYLDPSEAEKPYLLMLWKVRYSLEAFHPEDKLRTLRPSFVYRNALNHEEIETKAHQNSSICCDAGGVMTGAELAV